MVDVPNEVAIVLAIVCVTAVPTTVAFPEATVKI